MEFSGPFGQSLSVRTKQILAEFNNLISHFCNENYNPLDLTNDIFLQEYVRFSDRITDMDIRLSSIFNQAFENSYNMDSFFKVFTSTYTIY